MEPHIHQLLQEQKRTNTKIQQLSDRITRIYETKEIELPYRSSSPVTSPRYLTPAYEQLDEGRLSDNLELLNDDRVDIYSRHTLARYDTSFIIIKNDADLLPYRFCYPGMEIDVNERYILPYMFADDFVTDQPSEGIYVQVEEDIWRDDYRVYKVTQDRTIRRIEFLKSVRTDATPRFRSIAQTEALTLNLSKFLHDAALNEISLICCAVPAYALKYDNSETILTNLLTRTITYFKLRKYVLHQQELSNQMTRTIEIQQAVNKLQRSSVNIGGLFIPKDVEYTCPFITYKLGRNDSGDRLEGLILHSFFQDNFTKYTADNLAVPRKLYEALRNIYDNSSYNMKIKRIEEGVLRDFEAKAIGVYTVDYDLDSAAELYSTVDTVPVKEDDPYSVVLQLNPGQTYTGRIPLIRVYTATTSYEIDETKLKYMDNQWKATLPNSMEVTQIALTAASYVFPPEDVIGYYDTLLFYPPLLPYATDLGVFYEGEMRFDRLDLSDNSSTTSTTFRPYDIDVEIVSINLSSSISTPALRIRATNHSPPSTLIGFRQQIYKLKTPITMNEVTSSSIKNIVSTTPMSGLDWVYMDENGNPVNLPISGLITLRLKDDVRLPIMQVPDGFTSVIHDYDVQAQEMLNLINTVIARANESKFEIFQLKKRLGDVELLTEKLVEALNQLQDAYAKLVEQLKEGSHVPWWKKVLSGLAMVLGTVSMMVFPFCAPLAIGLIAGSTAISVGMLFAEGDYITGGIQLAGVAIGMGISYYTFRSTNTAAFSVTDLKKAEFIEPPLPAEFDPNLLRGHGLWVEVKPLQMLGRTAESLGDALINNHKGVLRTLFKLENAPVHARVRAEMINVVDNEVYRTTVVSGVTDGMAYLSRINPRPGVFEMKEVYVKDQGFVNGWTADNVPVGGNFENLERSIQGLLMEGVGTNAEFQSLINSWSRMDLSERAIALNDAQSYIKQTQVNYTELTNTRVPINFDPTLVKGISNVFAKHAGIYELTGLTAPSGPNNCQTYAKELRDFFAKGALRKSKLNNSSFLNDIMEAFDSSTQFKHSYGKVFEKNTNPVDPSTIPPIL